MTAPPRAPRLRRFAVRAFVALAGLVLIAIVAHPWWLAPAIGRYLSSTSGREVHFDSIRVGLSASLAPVIRLRGVRIANAPWADTTRPFAAVEEAVFVFAWRRFEDRRVVSLLVLRNGEVDLERAADGRRNWRLRDPEDRGPGHYWFFSLEPHDARLSFVNRDIDLRLQTAATDTPAPASPAALGEPLAMRVDFEGAFREVAFKGSVAAGPVLTFLETRRWFGVRGDAEVDGARLHVDGRAADIFRWPLFDARLALDGRSLAVLRPFFGHRYAEPRAFRAEGHLIADERSYALSGAEAHVGSTDLSGDLAWSRGSGRRSVQARVHSPSADLADLLWLAGRGDTSAAAEKSATAAVAASPAGRDSFASLRDVDVDVTFEAHHLRAAAFRALQSVRFKAGLVQGRLSVDDIDVGWAGGHSTGTLALDARQPAAVLDASIETSGVRAEALLGGVDEKKRITGVLSGTLALAAKGNDAAALRSSVSGTVSLALKGGTIPSLLDAELGLEGGKLLRTLVSGNEPLALPCAQATFDLRNGRATVRSLVMVSANTKVNGSGTIDLRDESVDLVLTPEPKRPGAFELRRSIRVFGRFPKPEHQLVDRVEMPAATACVEAKP